MKYITLVTALAAVIPAAFGLTINTPATVNQCEPTQFNWNDGTAPFYLSLVPARQTTAPALKQFPPQNGSSFTWTVDLGTGTSFTIALKDSTGATAYSDIVTVQAGVSASCINTTVTETGTSGTGTGSSPASTGSSGGAAATGTSASSPATTSGSSSSTKSSGAGRLSVSSAFGVAGVMGLLGAVLL
ncbi:hypothetical protein L210DRAFT_3760680 [Boletus edulis BED1]|uniref:Uncharacterized protein n=1 Tax=Boletus edulis BED1 TaxID=1328754 RepID=A0AAD4GFD1_BOLED|nr:hypothetical protein L210DRAFT_3760680 [Boletus edulis BED1]